MDHSKGEQFGRRALLCYFSYTGNTRKVAAQLHDCLSIRYDVDLVEIRAKRQRRYLAWLVYSFFPRIGKIPKGFHREGETQVIGFMSETNSCGDCGCMSYCGIPVKELNRSLKFYTELFGLKEVARGDHTKYNAGLFVLFRDDKSDQNSEVGLLHNVGGTGATAAVFIYGS